MGNTTAHTEQLLPDEDAFPLGFPTEQEAQKRLVEALKQWREASDVDSVTTLRLELKCDKPKRTVFFESEVMTPPARWHECSNFPLPEPRPRPPVFDMDLVESDVLLVKCIERLEPPTHYCAQLYEGTLSRDSANPPTPIIVKVYQTSFDPRVKNFKRSRLLETCIEDCVPFRREKWAYDRMACYEGTVVPHTAGFFQTTLPHGEPAVVLVMEHVDSLLERYLTRSPMPPIPGVMHEADVLQAVVHGIAATTHAMFTSGVAQLDMCGPNFLWPTFGTASSPWIPVAIDFIQACGTEEFLSCREEFYRLSSALQVLKEYNFSGDKIADCFEGILEANPALKAELKIPDVGESGYPEWDQSLNVVRSSHIYY